MWMLLICCLVPDGTVHLDKIFLNGDVRGFSSLLAANSKVKTNLRPLLYDHGTLSPPQIRLAFKKLITRFHITKAEITSKQADTNFAWVEVTLSVLMQDRQSKQPYRANFALQLKYSNSKLVLSRWILQDVK